VRTELGRFKTSADYGRLRHRERHLANASFALGMVASMTGRRRSSLWRDFFLRAERQASRRMVQSCRFIRIFRSMKAI